MYLIINRVYGYVSEKNGVRFLKIDKGDSVLKKYDRVFAVIKHHIKKVEFGNKSSDDNEFGSKLPEVNYNSDYDKI